MLVSEYTDLSVYGFFGGAAPGIVNILRGMFRVWRTMRLAREVARQKGEFLDFDSSENQNLDFMFYPQNFIKPNDGPGARSGKELLLSIRPQVLRRYKIGVVMMLIGIPIGMFVATSIEYLFLGRPW
jgi:hypothetical protein